MAQGDYRGALAYLDTVTNRSEEMDQLRLKALLVEGRTADAWQKMSGSDSVSDETAETIVEAVVVIMREKSRVEDALPLLESALGYDPSLKPRILDITWQRGVEYMSVPGTAGYRLIRFTTKNDSTAFKRLMSANPQLAARWEEIDRMYALMTELKGIAADVSAQDGTIIQSLDDLPMETDRYKRPGWELTIQPIGKKYRITATAKAKHPAFVLYGTTLVVQ